MSPLAYLTRDWVRVDVSIPTMIIMEAMGPRGATAIFVRPPQSETQVDKSADPEQRVMSVLHASLIVYLVFLEQSHPLDAVLLRRED